MPVRVWSVLLIIVLTVTTVTAAQAQGEPPWTVVLYHESGTPAQPVGELVVLTPNGIVSRMTLPPGIYQNPDSASADVVVSPDRRYAAIAPYRSPIVIADLANGTCCTALPLPHPDIDLIDLVGFDPAGAQLAYAYLGFTSRDAYETEGGLVVVDVATGQTVASTTTVDLVPLVGEDFRFPLPGSWTPEGVQFVPSCYGCEPRPEGPWTVWNPATNTVIAPGSGYYTIFGETLPVTGELIVTTQNPAFPVGEPFGMFPPANVVEYYPEGVPLTPEERQQNPAAAQVVYHNPTDLDLRKARWISDGNALFVPGGELQPQGVVVLRDGTQGALPFPATDTFLAGTVDGFLGLDENGWVVHYQMDGTVANSIPMEQFAGNVRAVHIPPLGATVTQPFATVTDVAPAVVAAPNVPSSATTQCPGFLPSRLTVGGQARVMAGSNLNMRISPSTAAVILTVIREGTTFPITDGPQCDPGGIAWWQTSVDGQIGWIAEGRGSEYYVEPA